jgi:hypothetical protein
VLLSALCPLLPYLRPGWKSAPEKETGSKQQRKGVGKIVQVISKTFHCHACALRNNELESWDVPFVGAR